MKGNLIVILIGMVAGFIGIIPLLRQKADKLGFCPLPVLFHDALGDLSYYSSGGALVDERSCRNAGTCVAAGYCCRKGI